MSEGAGFSATQTHADSTAGNERAVSTALSYVLALGITTLLATGLILAGGEFVTDQRERAIQTELQIVGEQLASDIERLDRVVAASPSRIDEGQIRRDIPDRIAGQPYVVELTSGPDPALELRTKNRDMSIIVPIHSSTAIGPSVTVGGSVVVRYDDGDDEIEVDNA